MTTTIDIAGLEDGPVSLASEQLDDLDSRVEGRLVRAGDDGWDDTVLVSSSSRLRRSMSLRRLGSRVLMGSCSASRAGATTSPEPRSPRAA